MDNESENTTPNSQDALNTENVYKNANDNKNENLTDKITYENDNSGSKNDSNEVKEPEKGEEQQKPEPETSKEKEQLSLKDNVITNTATAETSEKEQLPLKDNVTSSTVTEKDKYDSQNNDVAIEIMEKTSTILSEGEQKFIANVLKCCQEQTDIDAYQVMAFDHQTKTNFKGHIKYIFDIIKCILCAATQVAGILIIMWEVVKIGLTKKNWCNIPSTEEFGWLAIFFDSNLKVLSFLFSSFLAYFSIDRLTTVQKGMYYKMKYADKVKWVDSIWLRIGFTVNLFVSIIAVYGSFLVIFFSDNSLDMVLNSVALFFIIELDDLLVKNSDYDRIEEYITKYDNKDLMIKETMNKEETNCCKYCCYSCCFKFGKVINWFVAVPFTVIQYVTIAFCLFCPGLIIVCY